MHAIGEMPTATSVLMASILAQQFVKLQAPPFHKPLIEGVPQAMSKKPIVTPLQAEARQKALVAQTNQEWVTTLVEGMCSGFRAGLQESLVGHLVHATKVLPLGKAFLNTLFAIKAELKPGQARRISLDAWDELAGWDFLLDIWVGLSVW